MKNGILRKTALLSAMTPYPWRRDRKGNLCGRNRRPVYFQGADAIAIEYAPVILETLVAIRAQASVAISQGAGDGLHSIWLLADNLLCDLDTSEPREPRLPVVGTIS
jgi:hypothetical protein